MHRRTVFGSALMWSVLATSPLAGEREIWTAEEAAAALQSNDIVLIDIRTRDEWRETGIPEGAWPISLHEDRFEERLLSARKLAGERPIALICASGGRSGRVLSALRSAEISGFVDVSEGMLGSRAGPGWQARGLPLVKSELGLAGLPTALR